MTESFFRPSQDSIFTSLANRALRRWAIVKLAPSLPREFPFMKWLTALSRPVKVRGKFAQRTSDAVFSGARSRRCRHHFDPLGPWPRVVGQNFIGRQHPIHWNRRTTLRWTDDPKRAVAPRASNHLDLPAADKFAAAETVTFIVKRVPMPKLIKTPQSLEFILIAQSHGSKE